MYCTENSQNQANNYDASHRNGKWKNVLSQGVCTGLNSISGCAHKLREQKNCHLAGAKPLALVEFVGEPMLTPVFIFDVASVPRCWKCKQTKNLGLFKPHQCLLHSKEEKNYQKKKKKAVQLIHMCYIIHCTAQGVLYLRDGLASWGANVVSKHSFQLNGKRRNRCFRETFDPRSFGEKWIVIIYIFFNLQIPTLLGTYQLIFTDRRTCCITEEVSCHALLRSLLGSWQGSVVPVVAMRLCSFALTCDHVVTAHGIVTVANAGARSASGPLHNSDDGSGPARSKRSWENLYLQVFCFSGGVCLISFMPLFKFHSDNQRHITCHYFLRPLKHFQ